MVNRHNRLSRFWQELKRRNVTRVIAVYAATAFVILEVADIVAPSIGLPDWTLNLIIFLLAIGFIIAAVVSWIFDFHPLGGIVKTQPVEKTSKGDGPAYANSWKIAAYISFVVIGGLIAFNILTRSEPIGKEEQIDKSIAVLPFTSMSDDPDKGYLADGMMNAILLHLSKVEDLRVMSGISVEQYRETEKTPTLICEELDVAYLLEGSFQKYGDQAILMVQLIRPGKEGIVWGNQYDREWNDIFSVQSEVAQQIAFELQALITPEEKQLIEKKPTTSLTAYDFYQRARVEHETYGYEDIEKEALERAEYLYYKSLEYDSTFALAYTGLALVYREKHRGKFLNEDFLDSMLILADIALSFDDQLADAYVIRGDYFDIIGKEDLALVEYNKAIRSNPNEYRAYFGNSKVYFAENDYVNTLDNAHKAIALYRGPRLSELYARLSYIYHSIFKERSIHYSKEILKLDNDSAAYYHRIAEIEETNNNLEKALELYNKAYAIDSTNEWISFRLGVVHSYLGLNEAYLYYIREFYKRWEEDYEQTNFNGIFRRGHAYWVNGLKEEGKHYFDVGFENYNKMLELDRHYWNPFVTFYNLASAYAFLGERDKAFEYLKRMNQMPRMPLWMIKDLINDPLFDSIRDEPEFQQILQDVKEKYEAEHERVRQWLEENEML